MSDQTDVNIDSVDTFGNRVMNMLGPLTDGFENPLTQIVSAKVGMSGLSEANVSRIYHGVISEQSAAFLGDLAKGVGALGYGALTIAINYRTADMDAQRQMDEVNAAFTPQQGQASLTTDQAQNPAGLGGGAATLPAPEPSATTGVGAGVVTPQDEVQRHQDLYGKDEDWIPPAARQPEEPVILAPGPIGYPGAPYPGEVV